MKKKDDMVTAVLEVQLPELGPFERIERGAVWGENLMYDSVEGQ
jgi:hypothetical protein